MMGRTGQHVNDRIKVRDAQSTPTGADLSTALEELPGAYFSITGDISRAHRLVLVRSVDWARQACRAYRKDRVYLNAVGTFGHSLGIVLVVPLVFWLRSASLLCTWPGSYHAPYLCR